MSARAVVVGAGLGGLSAAAHLLARGAKVTVIERAATVGGKAGRLSRGGFSWDTGPTLLTMPDVVNEPFAALGARLADEVRLERIEPACEYVFEEGRTIAVSSDRASTRAQIARVCAADAPRWDAFLERAARIWRDAGEPYVGAPYASKRAFAARVWSRGPSAVKTGMTLGTLAELADRSFESSEVRRIVRRYGTYAGGDPRRTSAAFAMIAHLEAAEGAWAVEGGIHEIARALARIAERAGGRIVTGATVTEIALDSDGRARGVVAGERHEADVVVCNAEPRAAARLLPGSSRERARLEALPARARSLSAMVWLVGLARAHGAGRHTVLFARDHDEEFRAIFDRADIAHDPTVYVHACAPDALHVQINAPARPRGGDAAWPELRARIAEKLDAWRPGLTASIVAEARITPDEIGAIYGDAPHGALAPFERPSNRAEHARGLYYVGGATHPGGGVPMVARGGRFVAELAAKDGALS